MRTTSVQIDLQTHGDLKRLASDLHLSVGETVRYAVRRLNQAIIGEELRAALTTEELAWLDSGHSHSQKLG
jgi:Arc/MetJ-type ribon-helix-helix transcriptional regulator